MKCRVNYERIPEGINRDILQDVASSSPDEELVQHLLHLLHLLLVQMLEGGGGSREGQEQEQEQEQ